MRLSTTDIINYYFTRKQYEYKNVRMQRGFRVRRCSIKLLDLTGNSLLKCKTMPYCDTMGQTQSIIITLSCSVQVSRIETTSEQAAAEAPLEQEWDAIRFEPVRSSFCSRWSGHTLHLQTHFLS